ncbi:MAG TPA: DUF4129 domain-containing protein, partial [Verrucomicrobiae bacterium]|nr:DUF4129 domain-containing protein [Verrucomicrobiae bacterium]
ANQHLTAAALGMALSFLWMKFWQAVFARKLRALISVEPAAPWNVSRGRRVFLAQAVLQPSGLFLLPLSLLPVLPFAWAYAFYQNLTALDDGESSQLRSLFKQSCRQAALCPRQNHLVLAILLGFGFYVFLNWATVCFVLPGLAKMLFSVESVFSRSGTSLLNTTFFAAMFGLTYLSVDPIAKAVYVLRCFYGESLESGEDLKAELKRFVFQTKPLTASIILAATLAGAMSLNAADAPPPTAPDPGQQVSQAGIPPPALDRAINEVIQQRKYTWRMPRENVVEAKDADKGIIGRFLERVKNLLRKWYVAVRDWLEELLRKLFKRDRSSAGGSGYGWIMFLQLLLYALVAAVVIGLVVLLYRVLRGRRPRTAPMQSEAIQPGPDLADENVGADQLPEDGWIKLARELLERGELRLAMRAFYLASLSHLAGRNLISLAKFKSNRDYERELRRRGHSFPDLLSVFGETVSVFDRIWYGLHEVNGELVQQFAANVERIKGSGSTIEPV